MIAHMEQVEILCLRTDLESMAPFLQDLGVIHLEEVPLTVENHPGFLHRVHLSEADRRTLDTLEAMATKLKEIVPLLSRPPAHADVVSAGRAIAATATETLKDEVAGWHRHLRSLSRRRLNAQDNIQVLENYGRILQAISPLLEEKGLKLGRNARALVLESHTEEDIEGLRSRLKESVSDSGEVLVRPFVRGARIALLIFPEDAGKAVDQFLEAEGISGVRPPDPAVEGVALEEVAHKLREKLETLQRERAQLGEKLEVYSQEHGPAIVAAERVLADRIAQLRATDCFAQSELVAVVRGWVPEESCPAFENAIQKRFGGTAVVSRLPHGDIEAGRIPTKLTNHPLLRPFQLILSIFDPPTYGTLDPTLIVAVSFTVFYGFILGDVGYGLFLLAVAYWAGKRWHYVDFVADAMTIAKWMGASSIVWGLVYGEFFGNLPELFLGVHPLLHRAHDPMLLLFIAVAYGVVHIPLSLLIGIREGYRHGHKHHAEEKLGMLLGLLGVGTMVAGLTGLVGGGIGWAATVVLFVGSLFFLIRSMGAMFAIGIIELVGLTSNVLSYARLMALGLASVALADLANTLLDMPGPSKFLIGIPAAALVHLANIGIGVFSPTIHSLRLNYVEFLPKFYEPEGRNYKPFRKELAQWT